MKGLLSEDLGVVPIQRETVQTGIHGQLRDLLMRGRFQPGQPLKTHSATEADLERLEYFDARDGRGAEFHIAAVAAMRRRDVVQVGSAVAADIGRSLDVIREVMFTADAAA